MRKKASIALIGMLGVTFCAYISPQLICAKDKSIIPSPQEKNLEMIAAQGGRVSWYKGAKHELIAYDAVVDNRTQNTEVFIMNPDGSGKQCVTCGSPIPKGFIGRPRWHPDGEHLMLTAESANSKHTLYNHMAWGINQDLWIIKKDGTEAELIYSTPLNHAVLHPFFNADGTEIIFADRAPTGKSIRRPLLKRIMPGGENPWTGWFIHIADFDMKKNGTEKLTHHRMLFSDKAGMYETSGFTPEGEIEFTYTEADRPYEDDCYIAKADGSNARNLTHNHLTWDEHGKFSPTGEYMAFISSRCDRSWNSRWSDARTLRTELYVMDREGKVMQLTGFNKNPSEDKRYLVSDLDWDKEGKRIVFEVGSVGNNSTPGFLEIWILTLNPDQ